MDSHTDHPRGVIAHSRVAAPRPYPCCSVQSKARLAYPRAALLLVRHYLDAGQPASALDIATPWCNSGKVDDDLSALHVAAYAALGRESEAVANYRRLVALDPDNPAATHTLAVALNAANQPEEGERVVRQTLSRTRPTAALHNTHARSLISSGAIRPSRAGLARMRQIGAAPRRSARQPGATRVDAHRQYHRGYARSGSGARKIRA